MRINAFTTTTALLLLTACSSAAKDSSMAASNEPQPTQPASDSTSLDPMDDVDADVDADMDADMDADVADPADTPASAVPPQQTVYTERDPFVEPTLSEACGWNKPTVYFSTDSAKVGLVGDIKADLLSTCLNNETLSGRPIVITGYADEEGTDADNRALGLERANAVKDDLVKAGIAADRITTYSKGEYFVQEDGASQDERRVVVKLDE